MPESANHDHNPQPGKAGRRKRGAIDMILLFLIFGLLVWFVFGNQERAKTLAVQRSLEDFFSARNSYGKLFIEDSDYVPRSLSRLGPNEVEVLSKEGVITKFEGNQYAPAMAYVKVKSDFLPNIFNVSIDHSGVPIQGATMFLLGRGKSYRIISLFGRPVLVKILYDFVE